MPYTIPEGNATDLGFYEGVEDDHANLMEFATTIGMNEPSIFPILSYDLDNDVFKIKSAGLKDEGTLRVDINRNLYGTRIHAMIRNPITGESAYTFPLTVVFKDGSQISHNVNSPTYAVGGRNSAFFNYANFSWNLSEFKNVDYYSFSISNRARNLGAVKISTSNQQYLDQANFLTEEEIAQLQIESRVNDFNPIQAIAYQLAIPNVPIDAAAFAETALVYSALMGRAPSKAEVAKLTFDPYFEVRPLAERARLILEMPAYTEQFGMPIPEVDFITIRNGQELNPD